MYIYNITNYINVIDSNTHNKAIFLAEAADSSQQNNEIDSVEEILQPRKLLIAKYNLLNKNRFTYTHIAVLCI